MLNNSSPPPTSPTANVRAHYPPGLLDLSRRWVNRLPVAPWICYLALFVLLYVMFNLFYWIDGLQPWGRLRLLPSPIIAWNVLTLAFHHYLDDYALTALQAFRPAIDVSDEEYAALQYQLTTLPLRQELLGGLFWIVVATGVLFAGLSLFATFIPVWEIALAILTSYYIGGAFFFHTFRQLRMVSGLHAATQHVDLFDPGPAYAFSGLTARTAIAWVFLEYATLAALPPPLRSSPVLIPVFAALILAALVFVLPLLGMHNLLSHQQQALESEVNRRLKRGLGSILASADANDPVAMAQFEQTVDSLLKARQIVDGLPTWPWQPATVRGLATAILLPLLLWLLQELLTRFLAL
jgi:hypothetical protein